MKEALKLALEALEWINRVNAMDYEYQQKAREALNAIKEALAQPEQEPVAWEQFYPDIGKPQLKQELVAIYRAGQAKGEGFHVEFLKEMGDDEVLLYAISPQRPWVGLTNEDMYELGEFANTHGYVPTPAKRMFAKIEAKLKEKNT